MSCGVAISGEYSPAPALLALLCEGEGQPRAVESSEERSGRVWPSVMATTRSALFASLSRAGEAAGCVERSVGADWCVIAEGGLKESVEGTAIALREAESPIKRTSDREGNGLDREDSCSQVGRG